MKHATEEVGLHKLLLFPEKLAALQQAAHGLVDALYPVSVELSLTNRCNQNCLWCSDKDLRERSPDRLSLDLLKNLFADLAEGGAKGITIEGGGEPTRAEFFAGALLAVREHGLAAGLITNGLDLFHEGQPPDFYRKFEWIRVSLDAASPGQYLELKGLDGFDRVLDNLTRLAARAPETLLGVGYVLTNRNDDPDRLRDLAERLRKLGAAYLHVRPVVDHPELISRRPLGFLKDLETPDFSVNLAALHENLPLGNNGLPCLAHSLTTVIGADGLVWLCGRLNGPGALPPIGSLLESSFREIWQGPERARQAALAASPNFCQARCPQCRMTKFNQLLDGLSYLKSRHFI